MLIKNIILDNFRIYKGVNEIDLLPEGDKNIIIISGRNGYGKTTFLMSLVWCLYGSHMDKVDELYKKEIDDKGGYGKYIGNSLNRLAKANGDTKFSVSVTFSDVKIPDITCNEVTIKRSYDTATNTSDVLDILIDGYPNELIASLGDEKNSGEEIFIRDFILPIEVAKFFFFDAEKIVSLAEINSLEQRKNLSIAYSEVLGMQKYEDLRQTLERIQDEYRRDSAKPKDKEEFINLIAEIEKIQVKLDDISEQERFLDQEKVEKKHEASTIQEKLIREGNLLTIEQLEELRVSRNALDDRLKDLQLDLKNLYDLIPLGLAGGILSDVATQLDNEIKYKQNKLKLDGVEDKINQIFSDLEKEKAKSELVFDNIRIKNFYEKQFHDLIKKHFYNDIQETDNGVTIIHDFNEAETRSLNELIHTLQASFKDSFGNINAEYNKVKTELYTIEKRIREAEKKSESDYIHSLRMRKDELDKRVREIEQELLGLSEKRGTLSAEAVAHKKKKELLSQKIDVSKKNKKVDDKASELISRIKSFLIKFKEAKKLSLEKKMMERLQTLLHKKEFVKKVLVDINLSGDDVDINLYDYRNEKIDKGIMSMGERQMYASALLSALVDESEIEFPVFIDSPMQKFDETHSENIITHFYPNVSDQVVLFPLLNKELTEKEYALIENKVSKTYLIENLGTDSSKFSPVEPQSLFKQNKVIHHVD